MYNKNKIGINNRLQNYRVIVCHTILSCNIQLGGFIAIMCNALIYMIYMF